MSFNIVISHIILQFVYVLIHTYSAFIHTAYNLVIVNVLELVLLFIVWSVQRGQFSNKMPEGYSNLLTLCKIDLLFMLIPNASLLGVIRYIDLGLNVTTQEMNCILECDLNLLPLCKVIVMGSGDITHCGVKFIRDNVLSHHLPEFIGVIILFVIQIIRSVMLVYYMIKNAHMLYEWLNS